MNTMKIKYYKRRRLGGGLMLPNVFYYKKDMNTGKWYTYDELYVKGEWKELTDWFGKENEITNIEEVPASEVFLKML